MRRRVARRPPPRSVRKSLTAEELSTFQRQLEEDGLEFRLLESSAVSDELVEQLVAHFEAVFGRWPYAQINCSAQDHLRWKLACPITPLGVYLGTLEGRLAFVTTVIGGWVRLGGERILRLTFSDFSVPAELQGRGIGSRAMTYRREVLHCPYNLSLSEAGTDVPFWKRKKWPGDGPLGNRLHGWYRILDARRYAKTYLAGSRLPSSFARLAAAAVKLWKRPRRLRGQPDIGTVTRFDAAYDRFFEVAARPFQLIEERSSEFLNWRYMDPRGGTFTAREIRKKNELQGYAVLGIRHERAYIVDLLVRPECADLLEPLLEDLAQLAAAQGASAVDCWMATTHPYNAALARQGFLDSLRDPGIRGCLIDMPPDRTEFLDDPLTFVHFMHGGTDLI